MGISVGGTTYGLSADAAQVVLICVLALVVYAVVMAYLLCCAGKRKWGAARGMRSLAPDMRFVGRFPEEEEAFFEGGAAGGTRECPPPAWTDETGAEFGRDGETLWGRIVCLRGVVGVRIVADDVGRRAGVGELAGTTDPAPGDEDADADAGADAPDNKQTRPERTHWVHSEAYGTVLPGQRFRLVDVSSDAVYFGEVYRLPTEEEKKRDAEEEEAKAKAAHKDNDKDKKNQ